MADSEHPPNAKLYAYVLATGERDSSKEFDLAESTGGLWSDGTTMWVPGFNKLYAYTLATGVRDSGKDIDTMNVAGYDEPAGLWSDGTTMWVAEKRYRHDKLYAYVLATGARVSGRDIDTPAAAGNTSPRGLWSDGATIWVADADDSKIYAYYLPPYVAEVSATSTGRETATATVELQNPDSVNLDVYLRYSVTTARPGPPRRRRRPRARRWSSA